MTLATTSTTEFNVDELITLAYQLNGFGPHAPSSSDIAVGRQVLHLGLQALANTGIKLRTRELLTLTLTPGVETVDCPADTITIERGGFMRNADGQTDVTIDAVAMGDFQAMPTKTTAGMPVYYWPEQQSTGLWKIHFYPLTTSDWPTFIVPRTRKSRDVNVGNVTVDLDPRWHLTVVKFLQANIARMKGRRDLALELMSEYEIERTRAEDNETERGDGFFAVQATPWDDF